MATSSERATVVTLRGGITVSWAVVLKLIEIEGRGCTFELRPDGGICVRPSGRITPSEIEFLRGNRDEARRILAYQADDSNLTN